MMIKYDPNENVEKEKDDALEYYMRRCFELEREVLLLKDKIKLMAWSMEERD